MRPLAPATCFAALAALVACAHHPPAPFPAPAPTPTPDPARKAALALLRAALEHESPRSRVRLPADARIALAAGGGRAWTFRCNYYEYVPATSWPWIYEATGAVDLATRRVTLHGLRPLAGTPPATPTPRPSVEATP